MRIYEVTFLFSNARSQFKQKSTVVKISIPVIGSSTFELDDRCFLSTVNKNCLNKEAEVVCDIFCYILKVRK